MPRVRRSSNVYSVITGTQPLDGSINVIPSGDLHLPGHESYGTITVHYDFPGGIQGPEHPSPGRQYEAVQYTAYLPNNPKGQRVTTLLRQAFQARSVFSIETDGFITFNITHKTSITGGPQRCGYPDPGILDQMLKELANLGFT